jgi:hypothetical protein
MPGLRLHMTVAHTLAGELASSRIDAERGAYYLGATTPDIRVLTRWDRARTHFFDLDDFAEQSGVHRLFEQEPRLRDAASLDGQTAAFMAGYLSHLVMDEDYITQIYRPLFGERSDLRDDAVRDVMDKMLQWDIERADCEDAARLDEIRGALAETAVDVNVEFIAQETLRQWRDVSLEVIGQPPSVERLVHMLSRRMPERRLDDETEAAKFAEEVPTLLKRTWEHAGPERVNEYLHGAKSRAARAMREYLS